MKVAAYPVTPASVFPALARVLTLPQRKLPLATLFRLKDWPVFAQTLALCACRNREIAIGELLSFPPPWYDKDIAGDWGPPLRISAPGARALRIFHRAGIMNWRDLAERTPPQALECSGAGLMLLSEVLMTAIELATVYHSNPAVRHAAHLFLRPAVEPPRRRRKRTSLTPRTTRTTKRMDC
jgi:hypothetical protein